MQIGLPPPPPDVNGSGDVCACGGHTLCVGNVTQPPPALDAAELSMRWIGPRCRCNVRTGTEVHLWGSSCLCHLCFPVTSYGGLPGNPTVSLRIVQAINTFPLTQPHGFFCQWFCVLPLAQTRPRVSASQSPLWEIPTGGDLNRPTIRDSTEADRDFWLLLWCDCWVLEQTCNLSCRAVAFIDWSAQI